MEQSIDSFSLSRRRAHTTFPYATVFRAIESLLKAEAAKRLSKAEVDAALAKFKTFAGRTLDDREAWELLVHVIFYSGFRAETVTAKIKTIDGHLGDPRRLARFSRKDVARVLGDRNMIRNRSKVDSCIKNASTFLELVKQHGSFASYIESFHPSRSFEELLRLKEDLQSRFAGIGKITAYHVLTDLGLPVLKPDRVMMRIFHRLGLVEHPDDLLNAVLHGRQFAEKTGEPIRYIDIVFVAYGQVQSTWLGIDTGICLEEKPRCRSCRARPYCLYKGEVTSSRISFDTPPKRRA